METRKNQAAAKQAKGEQDKGSATPTADIPHANGSLDAPSALQIDPKLNQYHYDIGSPASQSQQLDASTPPRIGMKSVLAKKASECEGPKYHVSVMQGRYRIMPRFTLTPVTCPTYASLIQHINSVLDGDGRTIGAVKVMTPVGLIEMIGEDSWTRIIEVIRHNEWMDDEVRCVVDVE